LSQCEKGKWVRRTCLANDSQTFPYSSAATESSSSGSSLSTGAIVGIVIGVVVGLVFIVWAIWLYSKLQREKQPDQSDQYLAVYKQWSFLRNQIQKLEANPSDTSEQQMQQLQKDYEILDNQRISLSEQLLGKENGSL